VLLLPLFLAMDNGEFNNDGGGGCSGSPAAALAAAAVAAVAAAVDNKDGIQRRRWCGHLMAVAALMARCNGSGIGQ
jgi:hypothetical protein